MIDAEESVTYNSCCSPVVVVVVGSHSSSQPSLPLPYGGTMYETGDLSHLAQERLDVSEDGTKQILDIAVADFSALSIGDSDTMLGEQNSDPIRVNRWTIY